MTKTINELAENNEEIVTNAIEMNEIDSLCKAIEDEDVDKIEFLLAKDSIINYINLCNDSGLNILHRAVFDRKTEVFKLLIKVDGLVNELTKDENKLHLIHIAAITGNLEIINYLLDHNQELVNFLDENGLTPMWYSLIFKRIPALAELSKRGGVINYTGDRVYQAKNGNAIVIDTNDSSVDSVMGLNSLDIAILKNYIDFVKNYLEYNKIKDCHSGDNPLNILFDHADSHKNSLHISPLHLAFIYGRKEIVLLLIISGNYIHDVDISLDGNLHYLIRSRIGDKKELLNSLLDKGVDLNWRNSKGETALHFVIRFCYINEVLELLTILLKRGANPNFADNYGKKPLHFAIKYLNGQILFEVLKILLEHNASPDIESEFFRILSDIAFNHIKREDLLSTIKFISGCNVDQIDEDQYYFISRYATAKDALALFSILKGWGLPVIPGSNNIPNLKNLLLSNNSKKLTFYNNVNQSAKTTLDANNCPIPIGRVKKWPNSNKISNVVSENSNFSCKQKESANEKLLCIIEEIDKSIGECYECISELLPRLQKVKNSYRLMKENSDDLSIVKEFLRLYNDFNDYLLNYQKKGNQLIKDVQNILVKARILIWSCEVINKKTISIAYVQNLKKAASDLEKLIPRINYLKNNDAITPLKDYAENLLGDAGNFSDDKENICTDSNKEVVNNKKWILNECESNTSKPNSSSSKIGYQIDQMKINNLRRISR